MAAYQDRLAGLGFLLHRLVVELEEQAVADEEGLLAAVAVEAAVVEDKNFCINMQILFGLFKKVC